MLQQDRVVLVVVDFQKALLPSIHDGAALLQRSQRLIGGARILDLPILVTEQYPKGLGITDAGLVEALGESYQPIEKAAMSTMGEPAFREALKAVGRPQVLLCGIEAHVCVYQTARDLVADGREVHVVADCVSSRQERDREIALSQMQTLGCSLTTHEMAIFEMLKLSGTPEFKQWLRMIR